MLIKITDLSLQAVWIEPKAITCIIQPSPISPGDGKCQIIVGQVGVQVSQSECQRVLDLVKTEVVHALN